MPFHTEDSASRRAGRGILERIRQFRQGKAEEKEEEEQFFQAKEGDLSRLPPSQRKRFQKTVRKAEEQAFSVRSRATELGLDPTGKSPAQLQREIIDQERVLAGEDPEGRKVQAFRRRQVPTPTTITTTTERPARVRRGPPSPRHPAERRPSPDQRYGRQMLGGPSRISSLASNGASARLSRMTVGQRQSSGPTRIQQAGFYGQGPRPGQSPSRPRLPSGPSRSQSRIQQVGFYGRRRGQSSGGSGRRPRIQSVGLF